MDNVAINYGKPNQTELGEVTLSEIKKYYDEGQFPEGSMRPKIQAAISFLENGGKLVTISSLSDAKDAICSQAGTRIRPD